MIRSSVSHTPVYREVVKNAVLTAWHGRRYWIFALFAGILFSAGTYDVLWQAASGFTKQSTSLVSGGVHTLFANGASDLALVGVKDVVTVIAAFEVLLVMAILMIALGALSCASQAALVYAIGAHRHDQRPSLAECLRVGGRALWPVIALNAMTLTFLWIIRFLLTLPFWMTVGNMRGGGLLYVILFVLFLAISVGVAVIHVFTLNALVLQGASLRDSFIRAYTVLRRNVLISIETILLQIVTSIAIAIAFVIFLAIALVPAYLLYVISALTASFPILGLAFAFGAIVIILGSLLLFGFTVHFQYATWTALYRRLGEGGALPKIHRILRTLFGFFKITQ